MSKLLLHGFGSGDESIYFRSWTTNPDGSVAGPFGKVGTNDVLVDQGYESAKLAGLSIF